MQKIVAFVAPVRAGRVRQAGSSRGQATTNSPMEGDEVQPSNPVSDNSEIKIEALLSDGQTRRILESLLERERSSETDCLIDDFLELGIELAGPDACDLYERIVMAVERRLISRVYAECGNVKTKAAARLGINRNTLNKRLRQHSLLDETIDEPSMNDPVNGDQLEPAHEED
jgi:DNA-binding protein Fis